MASYLAARYVVYMYLEPVITDDARKHGVPDEDILHAFNNTLDSFDDPDDPDFIIQTGPDTAGRFIELGVVTEDHFAYILHAMPARRRYFPR